ncbi:MAG: PAS domain-containing protein [Gracilimonas sp.]
MGIDKAYWFWDILSDRFSLSPAFIELIGGSKSNRGEEAPSIDPETEALIKQWLKEQIYISTDSAFSCETTIPVQDLSTEVTLGWIGEITSRHENGDPEFVMGEIVVANPKDQSRISIQKQAEYFRMMMDHLPDSIFFKDKESRFLLINKTCAEKFGLKDPSKAIGKTDFDFFGKIHAMKAFEDEQQVMQTETPIIHKTEKEVFPGGEKDPQWTTTSKLPMYDDQGNVIGTFGITTDITRQKMTELSLKESDTLISKLSEQVPGFFYLYHYITEGMSAFPFASEGVEEVFEVTPKEIEDSSVPILDRIHKDDLERVVHSIRASVEEVTVWESDFRVVLPEKGTRWLRGKAKTELQPDDTVIAYGYITDVTDKKEIYRKNVRLKRQLQAILDAVPNLIFVKNIAGEYLMANKATAEFFGQDPKDIVGKTDVDLGVSKEKAKVFIEADSTVIKNNELLFIPEDKTIQPNGSEVWHQTIKVPFEQTDSNEPAVLSIATDITERKKNEAELDISLDIVGEQNKRLMNFAHIVSHNLRNHSGSISMLLEMFSLEESEEEKEEYLNHLQNASNRLNETIADLNEIIDEQYKNLKVEKEVNLREYINKTKQILTTDIKTMRVTFEEDIPDDLSFKYNPAYLESILLNLLSNAIKYRHPDRKPVISLKAYKKNKDVHFSISDNGLGIDLDKHEDNLFGMYKTFHGNENSKGIGLFITKNQIESLGGTIEVESEVGKGTTFKIVF